MAELIERLDLVPPRRRLDRDTLNVDTDRELGRELTELRRLLLEAGILWRREGGAEQRRHTIAQRVAILPWLFPGEELREHPHWQDLEAEARRLLAAADDPDDGLTLHPTDTWGALARSVLIDLSGRSPDEALAGIGPTPRCYSCSGGRFRALCIRRSELADARGDPASAAEQLISALTTGPTWTDFNSVDDVVLTRLGLCLLSTGRGREGAALLHSVASDMPGTRGAAVARAALEQVGVLPSRAR